MKHATAISLAMLLALCAGCATICKVAPLPGCPAPAVKCCGDCDGSGTVAASEVGKANAIKNGSQPLSLCSAADCDGNGMVTQAEVEVAGGNALAGCPK